MCSPTPPRPIDTHAQVSMTPADSLRQECDPEHVQVYGLNAKAAEGSGTGKQLGRDISL